MRGFLFLALVGCSSSSDPCSGAKGACIGLHIEGAVNGLDQLAFTIDAPNTMVQKSPDPAKAFNLPVRVALFPPAGTSGTVHITCDATGSGLLRAQGAVDAVLVNGHAEKTLTLIASSGNDLSIGDLAGADFAGIDFAGIDGPMPDLVACNGVTNCKDGDGCCPSSCNNTNDSDCAPVCGNHVVESGEACDDGNTTNGDNCDPTCHWANIMTTLSGSPGAIGYKDGANSRFGSDIEGLASDGTKLWILDNGRIREMNLGQGQFPTTIIGSDPLATTADGPFPSAKPLSGTGLVYLGNKLYFSDSATSDASMRFLRQADFSTQTVTSISSTVVKDNPAGLTTDGTTIFYVTFGGDLEKWKPGDASSTVIASAATLQAASGGPGCQFARNVTRSMGKTYVACGSVIVEVTDAGTAGIYAGDPFMSDCVNAAHKTDSHFGGNIGGLQGDSNGNLFAFSCSAVRQIAPADGGVTTYAGTMGTSGYQDGPFGTALFSQFDGQLLFAGLFSLYVGESGVIRLLDTSFNAVYTAGGLPPSVHDVDKRGSASVSRYNNIRGIVSDGTSVYAIGQADGTTASNGNSKELIRIDLASGTSTDLHAFTANATGITLIGTTLYVAISDGSIHTINTDGNNDTTFAGQGGGALSPPSDGTAGNLRSAVMNPGALASDGTDLYFTDGAGMIRKISIASSTVSLVAGSGMQMSPPNCVLLDGTGGSAQFCFPTGLTYLSGNLYTMDGKFPFFRGAIRRIDLGTRAVKSIVGRADASPMNGMFGDSDGVGIAAQIRDAAFLTNDGVSLFLSDPTTIRQAELSSLSLTTMIGSRQFTSLVNGSGAAIVINNPGPITFDATTHSMFFFDQSEGVIQKLR